MKRDIDLVRKILFKMEDEEKRSSYSNVIKLDGYSDQQINYHMKIMAQAGLLHIDSIETPTPTVEGWTQPKTKIDYYSISWDGHDFLDAARDDKRWEKAKYIMLQVGGFVFDVGKQLLIQYMKSELKLS